MGPRGKIDSLRRRTFDYVSDEGLICKDFEDVLAMALLHRCR